MKLQLPDKKHIYVTGPTDPVHRHYQLGISYFMNKRLQMASELLELVDKKGKLLDAGCGGGVFLPELSKKSQKLYAVDLHENMHHVKRMCQIEDIKANFSSMSIEELAFQDDFFDVITSISVLEFVKDLDKTVSELKRVLKKGGSLIIGFPVLNYLTNASYYLIGCFIAGKVHTFNHKEILSALTKEFNAEKIIYFPKGLSGETALYGCGLFRK